MTVTPARLLAAAIPRHLRTYRDVENIKPIGEYL